MEDRFKFRAWDKSFHKYCENVIVSTINEKITVYGRLVDGRTALIPNSHVILEQCTGLKDKNGKLIYEGDIIKDLTFNEDLAIIRFGDSDTECGGYQCFYPEWLGKYSKRSKYSMGWRKDLVWWCKSGIKVIGNIHNNPELLER